MKIGKNCPLTLASVCAFICLSVSTAQAGPENTWAILIGGGFTFNSTYMTDYRGIRDLKLALRSRAVPESQIRTYFAEGCRNGKVRIAAILSKPCAFTTNGPADITQANTRANVLAGFSEIAREVPADGTLVIGIATHGEKNGDLRLQNGTRLTTADLRSFLTPLSARGVRTILMSSACYSGNLHDLAGPNTCAFTGADKKHMTKGFLWSTSLLSEMAKSIAKGSDFLAAFETARTAELAKTIPLNPYAMNGMDSISAALFKSTPVEISPERLSTWQRKTGYERFDLRALSTFVPLDSYFEAIECAKTTL